MGRIADGSALGQDGRRLGRPSRMFRPDAIADRATEIGSSVPPDRAITRTMLALVGLGVVWRVARFAACPPLWGDEAFLAVNVLLRDFAGLLRPLEYYQIAAPSGSFWGELAVVRAAREVGVGRLRA